MKPRTKFCLYTNFLKPVMYIKLNEAYNNMEQKYLTHPVTSGVGLNISRTENQGFFHQFWEKAPDQNWRKMINLTSKL